MPKLPLGMKWKLMVCTEDGDAVKQSVVKDVRQDDTPNSETPAAMGDESALERVILVPGRSCSIYMSVPDGNKNVKRTRKRKA